MKSEYRNINRKREAYRRGRRSSMGFFMILSSAVITAALWITLSCSGSGSDYTELSIHNPLLYSGHINRTELPVLSSISAAAVDFETGRILYSLDSSRSIPPASMTKLVTLALLFEDIKKGIYQKDTVITVPDEGDFRTLPPRSSLMFLEKGQKLTVLELMKGLAVPSGNDAAKTAAILSAGSDRQFIVNMNSFVKSIGLDNTFFHDASGLSSENTTTADDFVRFCLHYIREYPDALAELNSLTEFTYPLKKNLAASGTSARGPIKQYNNNLLLGRIAGVDGLKTGYIDESGYNIAVTAERGGRRVVAVLMGVESGAASDGMLRRSLDAGSLLSYCFDNYHLFRPDPVSGFVKVSGGEEKQVRVVNSGNRNILLSTEELAAVSIRVFVRNQLKAPVRAGDKAGYGELFLDGAVIAAWDAIAEKDVPRRKFFSLQK